MHRVQYSYQVMHRTRFLLRYDRDPDNHPEMPDHEHLPPDRRMAASVTFREVLDEAYALIAEIEADDGDE